MTTPNFQVYEQVSRDAKVSLEDFQADFDTAFIALNADLWSRKGGLNVTTKGLKVTLPVPIDAAGYRKTMGDRVYRRLAERSFSMTPETYEDGVAELAKIIEAPDFIGFTKAPAAMAAAAAFLPDELIATLLEANPPSWEAPDVPSTNFFGTHRHNVLDAGKGTFSNDITGAGTDLTADNIGKARQLFRKIKGPNGKPLGCKFTYALIPGALEENGRRISQQGTSPFIVKNGSGAIVGAASNDNIYKGTNFQVADQLTSDTVWYAIGEKIGMDPWAICDGGTPESLILDKQSAMYELSRKVGFNSSFDITGSLCFSQLVIRFAGTPPS